MTYVSRVSELDIENTQEFTYQHCTYKRDDVMLNALNKVLETAYTHAFTQVGRCKVSSSGDVEFDAGSIIVVTQTGKTFEINSSEWGWISEVE